MRITNFWNHIEEHINQYCNDNRKGPDEVTKQQETDKEDKQQRRQKPQTKGQILRKIHNTKKMERTKDM